MIQKPQVAIIGAGPAGLIAAVILHKNGFPVRVYERETSRQQRLQGGSLDLHEDKGQVALSCAGLLDQFKAIARHHDQESKSVNYLTGELEQTVPQADEALDRPEIDRGVLRNLLLDALPEDAVIWNSCLAEVELTNGSDAHNLIFTDNRCEVADIIIGADGAWSRVRAALTPTVPFYTGITFLEGWIEQPTASQADFVGHGSLFSFGGSEAIFAQRNGQGRICVYAAVKRSQEWLQEKFTRPETKSTVSALYQDWAAVFQDLLAACETFVPRPICALEAEAVWNAVDGVALIGDAAHLMPPVGLGVNLAMLDGADIALALTQTDDWKAAIRRAETLINKRAKPLMSEAVDGFAEWFSTIECAI